MAADRGAYVKSNVFSGDAKAGEAFFNGSVGKCNTCHSVTGDLKGIGEKNNHDAPTLQGAILAGGRPRSARRRAAEAAGDAAAVAARRQCDDQQSR